MMKRRTFIKKCSASALCIGAAPSLLTACQTTSVRYSQAQTKSGEIIIDTREFSQQTYIYLQHPTEDYPICIVKISEQEYAASLMKCTHQHCTTEVSNDHFICPCHGAKFSHKGKLIKGPAERDLLNYKTRLLNNRLHITVG